MNTPFKECFNCFCSYCESQWGFFDPDFHWMGGEKKHFSKHHLLCTTKEILLTCKNVQTNNSLYAIFVSWNNLVSPFVFCVKTEGMQRVSTVYRYLWVNRLQLDKPLRAMTWQDLAELCDLNSKPLICVVLLNISVIVIFPPILLYGLFALHRFLILPLWLFLVSAFSLPSFACPSYFTVTQWLKEASVWDPLVCNERLKTDYLWLICI